MRRKLIWIAPLGILAMALFVFLGGEVVMQLWNWLLPALFGWRQLTFWQALGILALCRILFGHHGWRGPGHSNFRQRMKERMAGRCEHMTPDERERFRAGIRAGWGFEPRTSESKGQ